MSSFLYCLPDTRGFFVNFALLIIGVALGSWHAFSTVSSCPREQWHGSITLDDLSTTRSTFTLNQTFAGPPSVDSDHAWASLVPVGRGFVAVDSHQRPLPYRAGAAVPTVKHMRTISVFHQLHCLDQLRRGYYTLAASIESHKHEDDREPRLPHSNHLTHCFDYLRQALMCSADSTLETLKPESEFDGRPRVDGWGTEHTCRDWEELYSWAAQHRVVDVDGIQ